MKAALLIILMALALMAWMVPKGERITVKQALYGWATEVCGVRGWRTIIISHRNQLTVKCKGGGVHLYDASLGHGWGQNGSEKK